MTEVQHDRSQGTEGRRQGARGEEMGTDHPRRKGGSEREERDEKRRERRKKAARKQARRGRQGEDGGEGGWLGQIDRMVLVSFSLGERVKHDSFSQAATLEDNLWSTLRNTETILVLFFFGIALIFCSAKCTRDSHVHPITPCLRR